MIDSNFKINLQAFKNISYKEIIIIISGLRFSDQKISNLLLRLS